MQYRHSFHAGNAADVHKHVALLATLHALQQKPKGLLYVDTHAAGGAVDLAGEDARRGGEARDGWLRFAHAEVAAPELRDYQSAVHLAQHCLGSHHYPGSPLLAAAALRDVDRGIAVEQQAPEARALARTLAKCAPEARLQIDSGDGYARLAASWPPRERRGLALIDPPYEAADEWTQALDAIADALVRFETGVVALWFPIKRQRDLDRALDRVARALSRPTLAALLWLKPLDSAAGLNGSGMLIVNPPYAMSQRLAAWQEELRVLLGGGTGSGAEVRWLIHERARP